MIKNFNEFNNINEGQNFSFLKKYGIKELIVDKKTLIKYHGDLEQYFEDEFKTNKEYNWILKATIKDAIIEVGDEIIWHDGIWVSGVWVDGTWENGSWLNGTWRNGSWGGGEWYRGVWNNGVWKGGAWEGGTWLKGKGKPENA